MKERREHHWYIEFTDMHQPITLFGGLRYTDTMVTLFEYDYGSYIDYDSIDRNPNRVIKIWNWPMATIRSFETDDGLND